ncbi:LysR substrate-binding domain-containing protein, partial [uncultured Acinetobacter sp.]|uniref:LysR substrate-binding domain-containing protein n=1 Tax=uncultured Acinetobacter sp. TaxID=165433 RepID=UPI00258BA9EF
KLGDTEIVPVTLIDEDGNAKYDINNRFQLLSYSKNAYLRNLVDQVISNKLEYRILYETDHANNLKDFVLQGAGIAWLPKITIEEDLLKKKLKIINAREYIIKQQIFIFKNKIRKDDYLKIFWDSLRNIEFNAD